mmetsp:Transcript_21418/g.39337  ORF Transcript_21418/g.39337 Transcript_21418/m.39337 type:complete len:327 (+) Transcript_21418:193-1173(+)
MFVQTLTLAIVAACALQSTAESIYGIGSNTADFSTLVAAVNAAGLADALSGDGTLTLFAPPNSAFEKLPAELVTKLLDPIWKPQLEDLLKYHVLGSVVRSTDLTEGLTAETLNGEKIIINLDPYRINDKSNILVDELVDNAADNGVFYGIDTVLTPTSVGSNIVDIAAGNAAFSTLVTAVTKAGLVDALSGEGPLTVFAPTNDAFAALPDGTLDRLLLPENVDELTKILQYHVVSANAHSSTLSNGDVETLSGDSITVAVSDAGVKINDATTVVTPDIIASNGIIHVIDTVLFPPDDTDESTTSGAMVYGTIVSALIVAAGTIAIA